MNTYLEKVKAFHSLMDAPVLDYPYIPQNRQELRVSLIQEELNELKEAIADNNLVEVLDALCDLQYVLSGCILEFGLQKVFDNAFEAVHNSNMSKACSTEEELANTIKKYTLDNIPVDFIIKDGKYIVIRANDKKVLKNINYKPVDLTQFIKE